MKNKLLANVFLIVVLASGLGFVNIMFLSVVEASTSVNSMIVTSDTTWTKANSPYTLNGPVGIARGVTLSIEHGVTVNLGSHYLEVNGTLNALGTPTDKIVLNSNVLTTIPSALNESTYFPSTNAGLNILLVYDNPTCKIENAVLTQTSIDGQSSISNATLVLNNCSLDGNSKINVWGSTTISNSYIAGAVLLRGASTLLTSTFLNGIDIAGGSSGTSFIGTYTVSGNNITNQQGIYAMNVGNAGTISDNTIWGGSIAGICQADGFPTMSAIIERNLITNSQCGIQFRTQNDNSTIQNNTIANNHIGILNPSPLQKIIYNNIQNNSNYNLQLGSQNAINVPDNWWGTTDSAAIDRSIFDSDEDFNLGKANYTPFLTEPNPHAVPIPELPSWIVLPLIMIATLVAVMVYIKKQKRQV